MPKDKLTDYSATNASNTDVGGVNIDEGMLPSAVNNSIRELMTHLKNFSDGTDAITGLTVAGNVSVDGGTIKLDGNYPTGTNNVALGDTALDDGSLSGSNNTAIGHATLTANTSGSFNVAVGTDALLSNTTGENNIAVGRGLYTNTTGSNNTAVGRSALYSSTTSSNNTAVGYSALFANTTGTENTAVGANAGDSVTTATESTFLGYQAGEKATTGTANSFLGRMAGRDTTTGTNNTFVGHNAGLSISTGSKNVVLGSYGGNSGGLDIRTSSNNIVLSDGDGNVSAYCTSGDKWTFGKTYPSSAGGVYGGGIVTLRTDATSFQGAGGGVALELFGGYTTSTRYLLTCSNLNGATGGISNSGTTTSFTTSSDHRLKENVVDMTGATTRLKQLNPVRFNFIADADTTVDGFLAHEVQSVVPEAITGAHNEVDDDGNPVYQGIDQSKLVPLLVATIQELEARIAALESN